MLPLLSISWIARPVNSCRLLRTAFTRASGTKEKMLVVIYPTS